MGRHKAKKKFNPGGKQAPRKTPQPESPASAVRSEDSAQQVSADVPVSRQVTSTPPLKPDKALLVPIEFQAQVPGRAQRQFIKKPKDPPPGWKSDVQIWIDQWTGRIDSTDPFSSEGLDRVVEAPIDWRLISNSGTDEGVIRPVIGAGGWPLVPGSGIKGLFRRACPTQRLQRWCGSPCAAGDLSPGLLRFHGAWPSDAGWTQGLLDVAHPQQNWQVGFEQNQTRNGHSAFGVVSLLQPRLRIGLSSTEPLEPSEWDEIEATLKRALQRGLGGRTCAGYGSSGSIEGEVIFQCALEGQGPAAKLLDDTPEFRPTMFRAAIRGMALRVFGGLTDAATTLQIVGSLFGSLSREEGQNVGLLSTAYTGSQTSLGSFGGGSWAQPVYATSGQLQWRLARGPRSGEDPERLAELLGQLHGLVMALGGFGRGWRRPDHRIFRAGYTKTPIGTHWQWVKPEALPPGVHVQSPQDMEQLLLLARSSASRWLEASGKRLGKPAPWREVLHPDRVGIWVRKARDSEDGEVIGWFHNAPEPDQQGNADPRDLKKTEIGGRVNLVGRIWNRMLPLYGAASSGSPRPAGGAMGRPVPGGAMARPGGPASGRRSEPAAGPVSINAWSGPYLESVVLFTDPRDRVHGPALVRKLDDGAAADFKRIRFPGP